MNLTHRLGLSQWSKAGYLPLGGVILACVAVGCVIVPTHACAKERNEPEGPSREGQAEDSADWSG